MITIYPDGEVAVTTPRKMREETVAQFVKSNAVWIQKTLEKNAPNAAPAFGTRTKHTLEEEKRYKDEARNLATARLAHFDAFYSHGYSGISIRNQKTRWGSCSPSKMLSFNYRIALLPPDLADYVIVHELCHVKEMNHSKRFWDLVAKTIPNPKAARTALHAYR